MNEPNDFIQVQGINSLGFGIIPKLVMQDKRLTIQAKAIYSYFCSYAGAGRTAFPGREKIVSDLKISKDSYYKHFNLLKKYGYVQTVQEKSKDGTFRNNIYTLMETLPYPKNTDTVPCHKLPHTDLPDTVKQDTKNNSIKSNRFKNNIPSCQKEIDGQLKIQRTINLIHENIDYDSLKVAHADDLKLIDEFVSIILDALLSQSKTVRINGESKPRELVKSNLMKLTYADMEHVLSQFKAHGERIKKKQAYILSMLYHSPMELNTHISNAVHADWGY
jgi:hypothetical protein